MRPGGSALKHDDFESDGSNLDNKKVITANWQVTKNILKSLHLQ